MIGPVRRRLVGLLAVAVVACVPVVSTAQASQAADPADPVITSASLKLNYHYLSPTMGIHHANATGTLTLHIDMPVTDSGISAIDSAGAGYEADRWACYEAVYDPLVTGAGSLTRDGSHVTLTMPIGPCGSLYDDFPDRPGGFTLGREFSPSPEFLHTVLIEWNDGNTGYVARMAAPAKVQHFHLWSVTLVSESTSLTTIKGVRYRNLGGVLRGWDAPNLKWKRFAGAKVSLFFTPPGGTRKWIAWKYTASDGSYHFRTSNTKPGTWTVYFRTSVHYWTSSRSLTVR